VTTAPRYGSPDTTRLHFGSNVKKWLTSSFNKTFLRNEEKEKNNLNGPTIERLIPFWEFIDIEWDADEEVFHFRAWYTQGDFTINKPGEPIVVNTASTKPSTLTESTTTAIEYLKLEKVGNIRSAKWYESPNGEIIHLKYSKYYQNHMNFWYGITPESLTFAKDQGITHFGFITGADGCLKIELDVMLDYVTNAKTSDNEDGSVRHYHFFINSNFAAYRYDSDEKFSSNFISFNDSSPITTASEEESKLPLNHLPSWLTQALKENKD
jgi:hypothetical protein